MLVDGDARSAAVRGVMMMLPNADRRLHRTHPRKRDLRREIGELRGDMRKPIAIALLPLLQTRADVRRGRYVGGSGRRGAMLVARRAGGRATVHICWRRTSVVVVILPSGGQSRWCSWQWLHACLLWHGAGLGW